jgi:hypothetical protein
LGGGNNRRTGTGNNVRNVVPPQMPTTSAIYDDYIKCDHCNRKYSEQAYDKHLPTCERKAKETMLKDKMKSAASSNSKPNLNVRFGKK